MARGRTRCGRAGGGRRALAGRRGRAPRASPSAAAAIDGLVTLGSGIEKLTAVAPAARASVARRPACWLMRALSAALVVLAAPSPCRASGRGALASWPALPAMPAAWLLLRRVRHGAAAARSGTEYTAEHARRSGTEQDRALGRLLRRARPRARGRPADRRAGADPHAIANERVFLLDHIRYWHNVQAFLAPVALGARADGGARPRSSALGRDSRGRSGTSRRARAVALRCAATSRSRSPRQVGLRRARRRTLRDSPGAQRAPVQSPSAMHAPPRGAGRAPGLLPAPTDLALHPRRRRGDSPAPCHHASSSSPPRSAPATTSPRGCSPTPCASAARPPRSSTASSSPARSRGAIVGGASRLDSAAGNARVQRRLLRSARGSRRCAARPPPRLDRLARRGFAALPARPPGRRHRLDLSAVVRAARAHARRTARSRRPSSARSPTSRRCDLWAHPGIDLHLVTHPESAAEVRAIAGPGTRIEAVHGLTDPASPTRPSAASRARSSACRRAARSSSCRAAAGASATCRPRPTPRCTTAPTRSSCSSATTSARARRMQAAYAERRAACRSGASPTGWSRCWPPPTCSSTRPPG